jgi:hypothetical protein
MGVTAGVSRFESCYWDNAVAILQNPYVVSITDGIFFGAARLILQADKPGTGVYGLVVSGNQFQCESSHCPDILVQPVPGTNGTFSAIQVTNTAVVDNWYGSSAPARSARVTGLVTMSNATSASFNAADLLVFPGVGAGSAQYSLRMHSSSPNRFVRHSLGDWDDSESFVTVQTDAPADAAVYITIDQSTVARQVA